MTVICAHQPNFLPGRSVVEKVTAADAVVWLDAVQFTKGGFTNRNRLPDGSWLTVPIVKKTDGFPINRVEIIEGQRWRERMVKTIRQQYRPSDLIERVCAQILLPYVMLVELNVALLEIVLPEDAPWYFQSDMGIRGESISETLAMIVAKLGGSCYLSGPSGRRYLDEQPFAERGIAVEYFDRTQGANPCVLARSISRQPSSRRGQS